MIGPKVNLTYDYQHLGNDSDIINKLTSESHPFWKVLSKAKKPMIILGAEQLQGPNGAALLTSVQALCRKLHKKINVRIIFFSVRISLLT